MNCLQTASRDLSYGMSLAEDWIRQTGGSAARHCMAVAEAAVGDPSAAARSFAQIAQELPGDRWGDIGQLWAQAGHAWLLAEQPPKRWRPSIWPSSIARTTPCSWPIGR